MAELNARLAATDSAAPPFKWMLLALGVMAGSTSAILIRYATEAEPLAIAFWRCLLGALALAPLAMRDFVRVGRRHIAYAVVAGLFLALHFGAWITSLDLTTVAASVLLVSTTPVFAGFASRVLWGVRMRPIAWAGIALALAGTALIGGGDFENSSLSGDALALVGAIAAAGYFLTGQRGRREFGIIGYATLTFGTAALALGIACMIAGTDLSGYESDTWWAIAAIVIGPQLLGHAVINFVLRDIDATTVAVSLMAEPVIATSLALILFSEVPSAVVYPGGLAILSGIFLVSRYRRSSAVVIE